MSAQWQYAGSYNNLSNTAANKKGSIHDDGPARKLGFKGAFVPGSVVGACAMASIMSRFGTGWFDGGWYDLNFVSPVYTSDEVAATGHEVEASTMECSVVDKVGRLCCAGQAGLGTEIPWSRGPGDESIFPRAKVGTEFNEMTFSIEPLDVQPLLDASCETAEVWQKYIHPEHLMPIALQICDFELTPLEGVRPPGMWAQHALVQYKPLPFGKYRMSEHLAEKGVSGRTNFMNFQFHLFDESGEEVAVGRHKCKLIRDE